MIEKMIYFSKTSDSKANDKIGFMNKMFSFEVNLPTFSTFD